MSARFFLVFLGVAIVAGGSPSVGHTAAGDPPKSKAGSFAGEKAGEARQVNKVELCWCPAAKFTMGSPESEPERRLGEDQVEVTLTRGFWMGKYEVTQGLWKRVMGKLPGKLTAELPAGDDLPVGNVNFAEAEAFCAKLTTLSHGQGELAKNWEFRLPTEAQWEYACRAGTTTATAFGDALSSKQANFKGKSYHGGEAGPSLNRAANVGSYPANAWGLHDLHGNTYEWCRDWYHAKLPGGVDPDLYAARATALINRTGDASRVRRGGCWADDGWPCRSAFRLRFEPARRYDHIGFRVVAAESDLPVVKHWRELMKLPVDDSWVQIFGAGLNQTEARPVETMAEKFRALQALIARSNKNGVTIPIFLDPKVATQRVEAMPETPRDKVRLGIPLMNVPPRELMRYLAGLANWKMTETEDGIILEPLKVQ